MIKRFNTQTKTQRDKSWKPFQFYTGGYQPWWRQYVETNNTTNKTLKQMEDTAHVD